MQTARFPGRSPKAIGHCEACRGELDLGRTTLKEPGSSTPGPVILLVVASRDRRAAWRGVLEAAFPGCRVETARNGHEASGLLRARSYDGVLAESTLPDMSGLDLMASVSAERPAAVRILLARPGDADASRDATARGRIHGHLARDIPSVDAAPALRRIWGERKAR